MRKIKTIDAAEFLLLTREKAVSACVLQCWHAYQKRQDRWRKNPITLAHEVVDAKKLFLGLAITLIALGLFCALFLITMNAGLAPAIGLAVMIALVLLVVTMSWAGIHDKYNRQVGMPYARLLDYLELRSAELAYLSNEDVRAHVDYKLRDQAEKLVKAEREAMTYPHISNVIDRKNEEHAKMTLMFDCCVGMGLVAVPEQGWTPYFEGLQATRTPKKPTSCTGSASETEHALLAQNNN